MCFASFRFCVLSFFFFLSRRSYLILVHKQTPTRREQLTLCFQITLYADGLASILHSKYTSSPSSMSAGFMLVPKASFNSGTSVTRKQKYLYVNSRCLIRVYRLLIFINFEFIYLYQKNYNCREILVLKSNVFLSN